MKKYRTFELAAASLALLVSVPGRIAYGIILLLVLNLLFLSATAFRALIKILKLDDLSDVLTVVFLVFMSVLFRQLLILYSPLCALTLGFQIYLPALTSLVLGTLYESDKKNLPAAIRENMSRSGKFSLFAFAVFFIRDLIGYGTLSLPSPKGILELSILKNPEYTFLGVFFASTPGALVLVTIFMSVILLVIRKSRIAGSVKEEASDVL